MVKVLVQCCVTLQEQHAAHINNWPHDASLLLQHRDPRFVRPMYKIGLEDRMVGDSYTIRGRGCEGADW